MAINLVEYPNTSAPVENTDWTDMYALVAANGVPQAPRLTDWASVSAAPSLAQGAFILHEGSYYQVQAADETISGSPASGINYIVMSLSGSVLSASWTNSLTGYTYDPAYGAMYNAARDMLLTEVCYLDGSDYIRGRGLTPYFSQWILANGLTNFDGNMFVGGSVVTDRIASLGDTVTVDDDLDVTGDLNLSGGGSVIADRIASLGYTVEVDNHLDVTGDLNLSGGVSGLSPGDIYSVSAANDAWYELPAGCYQFRSFYSTSAGVYYDNWTTGFMEWSVYSTYPGTWENIDKTAAPEVNPKSMFYIDGAHSRLRFRTIVGTGTFSFHRF